MNKKLVRKLVAMMMFGVMGLNAVGCSTTNDKGDKVVTNSTDVTVDEKGIVELDLNKEFDLSYYGAWCEEYEPGCYTEQVVSEALNVNITIPRLENTEAVNLMLASGEMTDCGWYRKSPEFMYDQELVRPIPVAMVEKYAPNFIELYERYPELYAATLDPNDPTQFRYLTGIILQFVDYFLPNEYYRYDWILDAGIDLGVEVEQLNENIYVAKDGISVEKFEEIMETFVKGDPDGNGKNDTVGLNAPDLMLGQLFSGFGFIQGINNVNGEAEQWYATPQYKEYLKFIQDMYARGLIDPQILTSERNISWEMANKGNAGYWVTSTNALNTWAIERPPLSLIRAEPDVKILMTPGLKPEGGKVSAHVPHSRQYGQFYINANVDDEKLAKILQFADYTLFGPDRAELLFGELGVDWEWNEAGDMPVKLNELPSGAKGTCVYQQFGQDEEVTKWTQHEPLFELGLGYWSKVGDGIWMDFQQKDYKLDIRGETNYAALNADYSGEILAYMETYLMECALGKKDVDATWDEYLAGLDRLGYSELMDELDKLPTVEEIQKEYQKK